MSAPAPESAFTHETAIVESGVVISPGVKIWHHCHLRTGAVVGEGTHLGKNVFVDVAVQIGRRVKVQNNVSLYHGVTVEDDVFIGPSVVFTNDRVPRAFGSWTKLSTLVRKGASIGANATILPGIEIGPFAMVGAGAVVTRSVLHHQLVTGNPAAHRAWICDCGATISKGAQRPAMTTCATCTDRRGTA